MSNNEILDRVREIVIRKHGDLLLSSEGDIEEVIRQETRNVLGRKDVELEDFIISELIGLGPADKYLRDPNVNEIMINGPDDIYVEINGKIVKTNCCFRGTEELLNVLHRIVQRCGRKINFSSPLVDARLPDGSRVNAVIPPSAPYPVITIRKFTTKTFTTADLLRQNFLSPPMVSFFEFVVKGRANIVVAGATGCGKTTFIRWLCNFIPHEERLITIEDVRELELDHPHCVPLEVSEKADVYQLMKNALRMRPDRIILGEVRGAEAFELLQAMGTGHEGSITSVHSNYGKMAAIHRLVRAMTKAKQVSAEELVSMIAETIDILIFVKRFPDGARRIVHVSQVEADNGKPVFKDIFKYSHTTQKHEKVGDIGGELVDRLRENLVNEEFPESIIRREECA